MMRGIGGENINHFKNLKIMNMPTTFSGLANFSMEAKQDVVKLFSVLADEKTENRFRKLLKELKKVDFFEYKGTIYEGKMDISVIKFILDNPEKSDFSVWLDDTHKVYIPVS